MTPLLIALGSVLAAILIGVCGGLLLWKPRALTLDAALNYHHRCPDCRSPKFRIGPSGGLAVNIKCAGCGAAFWFSPPFSPERITEVEGVYTRPPVTLRKWVEQR